MMRQWTIDAFASGPFRGNPACVVEPFDAWPAPSWMQALAAENNQAETAFLLKTDNAARFGLRWFTPKVEVDLCGHATLASGHTLYAELESQSPRLTFDTRSGPLTVARVGEGYEMDLPASPPKRLADLPGLAEALGAEVLETWSGSFLVAVLRDEATVRALEPDLAAIETLAASWEGCIGVSALADPGKPYAVVDRMFGPGLGIPEDPTTGSLHCNLAPLYAEKLGRAHIAFHQAYPGRGGDLDCEARGDRVLLRGQAVTVLESRLRVRP